MKTCKNCNSEFESENNKRNQQYCSVECRTIYHNNKNLSPEKIRENLEKKLKENGANIELSKVQKLESTLVTYKLSPEEIEKRYSGDKYKPTPRKQNQAYF